MAINTYFVFASNKAIGEILNSIRGGGLL